MKCSPFSNFELKRKTKPSYITSSALRGFISLALKEDLGSGDHTSAACIPSSAKGRARLIVKDKGILAGVDLAKTIFSVIDSKINFKELRSDGDKVKPGDIAFTVSGDQQNILKAERLVLNCLQRMSGIATKTHQLSEKIKRTKAGLLDTRKTTPGFRMLEKWAVHIGGGINHRMGLYDMILIKDNHVDFCGGIERAILQTRKYILKKKLKLKIEVEVRNEKELKEVLRTGGIDRILLDNMTPAEISKAVLMIDKRSVTEASGGINSKNILNYARTGVDLISIGSLTHSYNSLDMSLKAY